jgi:hypothetical protein
LESAQTRPECGRSHHPPTQQELPRLGEPEEGGDGDGSAPGGDGAEEVVEEEFDLSEIMAEEVDVMSKEEQLKKAEEELEAEAAARAKAAAAAAKQKAKPAGKKKKKKAAKAKEAPKDEL